MAWAVRQPSHPACDPPRCGRGTGDCGAAGSRRTLRLRRRRRPHRAEAASQGRRAQQDHRHHRRRVAARRAGRDRRSISNSGRKHGRSHRTGGIVCRHWSCKFTMNFSAPFIVRPTATTLLVIGLTLLGLVAYFLLPIAGVPQVDIPTVQISAKLPGANAETMATSVAAPLERQLSLISGVTSMSSASSLGQTSIQVEFELGRSLNGATQDVQSAINAAGGQLPKNLPNPPTYEKVNPADALLMSIAISSPDLPIAKVDDYVENYLAPQISRITGVGLVDCHGQQKPAVRVQIDPSVASAMGLSLEDIRAAIGSATVNAPKGTLDGRRQSLTLDTTDQIFDASAFNSVIVAYRNGAPVRISDLGNAVNGVEDVREAAWLNGERAVIIDVHKQPGYNVNQTVQLVKDALPGLKRTLPPSIVVRVLG